MDETHDHGTEIFIQDGILLQSTTPPNYNADNQGAGSLSIVKYPDSRLCIEWRPNYFVMVEADAQDQEWAVVDTIGRRTRTLSGGPITNDAQSSRIYQVNLDDLQCFRIASRNKQLILTKISSRETSTFLFPNGNADSFAQQIKAYCKTVKAPKNTTLVIHSNVENEALKQSLTELDLFQDDVAMPPWQSLQSVANIVNSFKDRPYETTLETLAKISSIVYPDYSLDETPNVLSTSGTDDNTSTTHTSDDYEVVQNIALPPRPSIPRGAPLNAEQWKSIQDPEGRIEESEAVKCLIFRGGVDKSLRSEVWKYLLNYYPWSMTNIERLVFQKQKEQEYFAIKQQWKSFTRGQEERFSEFHEKKNLILKDVNRTDRTQPYYAGDNNPNLTTLYDILMTFLMYNFDLGYVQGMSDLLSPILYVLKNEVDAFWCFVGFMDKVENNFEMDQTGMKLQLERLHQLVSFTNPDLANYLTRHDSKNMYFCFRWLLVLFKREFSQDDIMTLWETIWTGLPCPNFHLLISVAILDTEKDVLMGNGFGFTEILKHVNDLSMGINLQYTISKAEGIYHQIKASSHLTDAIRIILGMAPLKAEGSALAEELQHTSISPVPPTTHGNTNGNNSDSDETNFQRSIHTNFL